MRFEDLDVWKRAAKFSAALYRELSDLKDYSFKDQITRSGLSVPSNIAEGFERLSKSPSCPMPKGPAASFDLKSISASISAISQKRLEIIG